VRDSNTRRLWLEATAIFAAAMAFLFALAPTAPFTKELGVCESGAVRDIATSVAQQNHGIEQIFSAVRDLNSIMEDATRRLDSNDRAVSDLKEVSDRVSGIVDTYRA